jgi:hypothetical protein
MKYNTKESRISTSTEATSLEKKYIVFAIEITGKYLKNVKKNGVLPTLEILGQDQTIFSTFHTQSTPVSHIG